MEIGDSVKFLDSDGKWHAGTYQGGCKVQVNDSVFVMVPKGSIRHIRGCKNSENFSLDEGQAQCYNQWREDERLAKEYFIVGHEDSRSLSRDEDGI